MLVKIELDIRLLRIFLNVHWKKGVHLKNYNLFTSESSLT